MRWLVMILVLAAAGCGQAGVGGACSQGPFGGDCVAGAICTMGTESVQRPVALDGGVTHMAPNAQVSICRQSCDDFADCPMGYSCDPVPTTSSLRSCQPAMTP